MANFCWTNFWTILLIVSICALALLQPTTSVSVNCRCGYKPWSTKDASSRAPTRNCCQYFIESGEGNFTKDSTLCQIENEFIYKRFHSCCISKLRSAYCFQAKLTKDGISGEAPVAQDPWARYQKLFNGPFIG